MKTAAYHLTDGTNISIEYDETLPCRLCGLPVVEASMGGTDVCPWCDLGTCRYAPGHRVDSELDSETGKMSLPRKHYERYHSNESAITLSMVLSLQDVERHHILRTLVTAGGNRTHAAKLLGISLRCLQYKLKAYSTT